MMVRVGAPEHTDYPGRPPLAARAPAGPGGALATRGLPGDAEAGQQIAATHLPSLFSYPEGLFLIASQRLVSGRIAGRGRARRVREWPLCRLL